MLWGFFPRGSGFRSSARGGPEASFFSSFRAFFSLFFGAVCTVPGKTQAFRSIRIFGLSLKSHLWAKSAFPLFLRLRWSTQPALSLPVPLFFPPFSPFLSIKGTYPVGFRPAWHEVLLTAASINDWIKERNAEIALCSNRCWFYYNGVNSLVHSFGVILPCRKRWLFSATIISWREFFRAERYAVVSTQHCSIFLANYHRFRLLNIFGFCRVINPNVRLEGVDQLDKFEYLNYMKLHLFHAEMP